MRLTGVVERTIPLSRYADPTLPSGDLTTSVVAVTTDVVRDGARVTGYGFASVGRYGQGRLLRERFVPRLLGASDADLRDDAGTNLDPFRAWHVVMRGEKPGGHGERCVAVGALDMALWDAASKIAELPLYRFLAERVPTARPQERVPAYAGGGYPYPADDATRLAEEMRSFREAGYAFAKMKIGAASHDADLRRVAIALEAMGDGERLAVDAMNAYDAVSAPAMAARLAPLGLRWFEDVCDPHDFATQALVAQTYPGALAAGEALFSATEAALLFRYGGLRAGRDVLLFDPAHCYGIPGYVQILDAAERCGWSRAAFWPHGGHLFGLHVAAAFGLGGCEVNPLAFAPFGGLGDGAELRDGCATPPEAPGIGFETKAALHALLRELAV